MFPASEGPRGPRGPWSSDEGHTLITGLQLPQRDAVLPPGRRESGNRLTDCIIDRNKVMNDKHIILIYILAIGGGCWLRERPHRFGHFLVFDQLPPLPPARERYGPYIDSWCSMEGRGSWWGSYIITSGIGPHVVLSFIGHGGLHFGHARWMRHGEVLLWMGGMRDGGRRHLSIVRIVREHSASSTFRAPPRLREHRALPPTQNQK